MEVKVAGDGEILARGPLTTPGYLNRPGLTEDPSTRTGGCTPAISAPSTPTGSSR